MSTLTNAVEDAKKVAEITKKYTKHPLFAGLVEHFIGARPGKKALKHAPPAKKAAKKPAKKQAAAPRGKKGEWPAKIRGVLQATPNLTAMDIITALGYEEDKSKAAHVRTVLSSLKKKGLVHVNEGKYANTADVLVPETAAAPESYASAE